LPGCCVHPGQQDRPPPHLFGPPLILGRARKLCGGLWATCGCSPCLCGEGLANLCCWAFGEYWRLSPSRGFGFPNCGAPRFGPGLMNFWPGSGAACFGAPGLGAPNCCVLRPGARNRLAPGWLMNLRPPAELGCCGAMNILPLLGRVWPKFGAPALGWAMNFGAPFLSATNLGAPPCGLSKYLGAPGAPGATKEGLAGFD